jgi:hypothetical protein
VDISPTVAPAGYRAPRPRWFPCGLGFVASLGVFATSLAEPWCVPIAAVWLAAFVAAALLRRGDVVLTVLASLTKPATAALVVWSLTHPHSPIGPHTALDWVPLGSLNAATGIWFLRLIRHRAG